MTPCLRSPSNPYRFRLEANVLEWKKESKRYFLTPKSQILREMS